MSFALYCQREAQPNPAHRHFKDTMAIDLAARRHAIHLFWERVEMVFIALLALASLAGVGYFSHPINALSGIGMVFATTIGVVSLVTFFFSVLSLAFLE